MSRVPSGANASPATSQVRAPGSSGMAAPQLPQHHSSTSYGSDKYTGSQLQSGSVGVSAGAGSGITSVGCEFSEIKSISLEWVVKDLRNIFESSKGDTKSRCVKSSLFGEGKWEIYFYANSGSDYVSLYLSAEPTPEERERGHKLALNAKGAVSGPALATSASSGSLSGLANRQQQQVGSPSAPSSSLPHSNSWIRDGAFRFVFEIRPPGKKDHPIKVMEAADHVFSSEARNWGWQSFARRNDVYYHNHLAKHYDSFVIACTITYASTRPTPSPYDGIQKKLIPAELLGAFSGLFDDPLYSDVRFIIKSRSKRTGRKRVRYLYAIKKVLCARAEYFDMMFSSGFSEDAVAMTTSDGSAVPRVRARPSFGRSVGLGGGLTGDYGDGDSEDSESSVDSDDDIGLFDSDSEESEHSGEQEERGAREKHERTGTNADPDEVHFHNDIVDSEDETGEEEVTAHTSLGDYEGGAGIQSAHASTPSEYVSQASDAEPSTSVTRVGTRHAASAHLGVGLLPAGLGTSTMRSASTMAVNGVLPPSGHIEPSQVQQRQERCQPIQQRKVVDVVVKDAAYTTYKALLYFLYTDNITFAPLSSSYTHAKDTVEATGRAFSFSRSGYFAHTRPGLYNPPVATPPDLIASSKAVYKLADKLGMPELKSRAFDHIVRSLSVKTIPYEAFSAFSNQFPEIRKVQVDLLLTHWNEIKHGQAMKNIFRLVRQDPDRFPAFEEVFESLITNLEYRIPTGAPPQPGVGHGLDAA